MDREDIIRLAREVGYPLVEYEGTPYIPPLLATLLETVAAAQRKPLTDEQMFKIWITVPAETEDRFAFARAIEAAHGIGDNT